MFFMSFFTKCSIHNNNRQMLLAMSQFSMMRHDICWPSSFRNISTSDVWLWEHNDRCVVCMTMWPPSQFFNHLWRYFVNIVVVANLRFMNRVQTYDIQMFDIRVVNNTYYPLIYMYHWCLHSWLSLWLLFKFWPQQLKHWCACPLSWKTNPDGSLRS